MQLYYSFKFHIVKIKIFASHKTKNKVRYTYSKNYFVLTSSVLFMKSVV